MTLRGQHVRTGVHGPGRGPSAYMRVANDETGGRRDERTMVEADDGTVLFFLSIYTSKNARALQREKRDMPLNAALPTLMLILD